MVRDETVDAEGLNSPRIVAIFHPSPASLTVLLRNEPSLFNIS